MSKKNSQPDLHNVIQDNQQFKPKHLQVYYNPDIEADLL